MNNKEYLISNNVDVDKALELWGEMDAYNDALKEFKNTLNQKITDLENFKNQSDWENYGILSHSIKSELKYLGFMSDAEVFFNHEKAGKDYNSNYIMNNFDELKNTSNKIIDIINNYFGAPTNLLKKIIIADDSNIVLSFLEKSIKGKYEVLKATNGNDVLSLIANNDIYAILLDLNMPSVNGFEVLEYLQNNCLINKYPVVIITGDDSEETIKKAFSYPIIDVLNKPFNDANLERVFSSIEEFYNEK